MWQKGQSGNPAGRKRKRHFDDYLRARAFEKRGAVAKALAERLIGEAIKGDIQALKLVYERLGGKPKSAEEVAANNGESLTLEQTRAKLAELLSRPEVRQNLLSLLAKDKPETEAVQ